MKIKIILVLSALFFISTGFFYAAGFRINVTASFAKGVYKITERDAAKYAIGDLIIFCLPENIETRNYVPYGFACRGRASLMKRVAAVSGDRIEVRRGIVHVNGRLLKNGNVFKKDGKKRDMKSCGDLTLSENEVFAMSLYDPKSFDSRYFGPITAKSITGKAKAVFIWEK